MKRGLDLFSGGGGCSRGYTDAGFAMYGIDNDPKMLSAYPFPYICMDAMEAFGRLLAGEGLTFSNGEPLYLRDFAFVHASPPCQGYSIMNNLPWIRDREYPLLILPVREMLLQSGLPYVIENVGGARYGAKGLVKRGLQEHGLKAGWLCGGMFGLSIYRHRYFESNWFWPQPGHPKHRRHTAELAFSPRPRGSWETQYEAENPGRSAQAAKVNTTWREGHDGKRPALHLPAVDTRKRPHLSERLPGTNGNGAQATGVAVGHAAGWKIAAEAMGIDWMKRHQLTQAVPPIMTQHIGTQLLAHLQQGAPV